MPSQTQAKRRSATNDGPIKRVRVSRACDQCRTERSKCDGHQPQCAPCSEGKRTCTYTSNPRKRGLPPGYIRTIELALAIVIQQHADIEASLIAKLGQPNTVLLARDTKDSNRLHKSWRRTRFCKTLNKVLTGDDADDEGEKAVTSDEDSDPEPLGDGPTNPIHITATSSLRPPALSISSHQALPIHPSPEMQRSKTLPEVTPLPRDYWKLLETYSTYTQCWLPISEKLDILKLSYSYPKQGLPLSHAMHDAGHHAEMWSMFALGSLQDTILQSNDRDMQGAIAARKLYAITQNLIPDELGQFHLGHVKALLNLALFNITSSLYKAAWLLVGAASRILMSIDDQHNASTMRRTHVLASCFLLDNLLSLSLRRRPYFETQDLGRAGHIEEDGLEEWQPWTGDLFNGAGRPSQQPLLALSSFNNLLEVVDILSAASRPTSSTTPAVAAVFQRRLESWKTSLSPKFEYVQIDTATIPLTPPAVLLQLTHFTASFVVTASDVWVQRIFELLEPMRQGLASLPCVISCLLDSIMIHCSVSPLHPTLQARLDDLTSAIRETRPILMNQNTPVSTTEPIMRPSSVQHATPGPSSENLAISRSLAPQPFQVSPQLIPSRYNKRASTSNPSRPAPTSLIDDLLPDMQQPPQLQNFEPGSVETALTSPGFDTYDPSLSGDLDNFLDELAFLHGAKKIQNQSQFMENLGFAPEISMADLLATQAGQFMPMNPAFGTDAEGAPLQFPLNDYYNIERG